MFEEEYRSLFDKFSKDLRELTKKRAEAGEPVPFDYIFYVRDKDKNPTNWASGTNDYDADAELVEGIIHEIILDDFRDLDLIMYDKETYIDQVHDLIGEIFKEGNKRLAKMDIDYYYDIDRKY